MQTGDRVLKGLLHYTKLECGPKAREPEQLARTRDTPRAYNQSSERTPNGRTLRVLVVSRLSRSRVSRQTSVVEGLTEARKYDVKTKGVAAHKSLK